MAIGITTIRKGDATRARIVLEAVNQASVRGLATVSLHDVADAVGLSKSGVFKHFSAKEALHLAVLETAAASFTEAVWLPAKAEARGRARMDRLFEGLMRWNEGYWRGGCPLTAAARELEQQPGDLRDYVVGQLQLLLETIARVAQGLTEPPLPDETGAQAAFEINGIVAAYKHSLSLGDPRARERAQAAYEAVVGRLTPP
jgi:AcrR family transcriptional regulator